MSDQPAAARGRPLLDAQIEALRRLMPPIDAFGVGGSHGRGTADAMSDVDFFLLVPDDAFWPFVHRLPALVTHPVPVVSRGVGRFMSDYGYRVGFILADGAKVEYFVNSPSTLTSLPLSARMQVLVDRTGQLTETLRTATEAFRTDPRPHVAAGVHDCLLEIHDLRKHASRGDVLPLLWRLTTLRRPVLALHHMRVRGDVYAPSSAASRLASRDAALADSIGTLVPTQDLGSIADAYEHLREVMLTSWHHFAPLGVPSEEQRRIEGMLSGDVLRLLRTRGSA